MMGEHDGHRDRLRRKFISGELGDPTDCQLLEMLLYHSIPRGDVRPLAEGLLKEYGDLFAILESGVERLTRSKGVGENSAFLIALVGEASKRAQEQHTRGEILCTPERVSDCVRARLSFARSEVAYIICLDADLRPVSFTVLPEKGEQRVPVILRAASDAGSRTVILAGRGRAEIPALSAYERDQAQELCRDLASLGMVLLDYIRVHGHFYSSAAELGLLRDGAPARANYHAVYLDRAPGEGHTGKVNSLFDGE